MMRPDLLAYFELFFYDDISDIVKSAKQCEGKHLQQVVYSTHHAGLTQICFGCKIVRTNLEVENERK